MALLDPSDLDSIKGGANAWLRLEMTLTGRDKAPASDRKELDAYLNQKGLQAGPWMDISLFKKVGEKETQLHETKEPLSFTVIVPASARNSKKDVGPYLLPAPGP